MLFTQDQKLYFLRLAYLAALESPDLSTQNGAVIVSHDGGLTFGCNKLPMGVEVTPERLERPKKYLWTEHAERNTIYAAARSGVNTSGATMFCPWFACADCGRAIIQSGIDLVIGHKKMFDETPDRWKDSIAEAFEMFAEAGVETELIEGDLGLKPIRFNEHLWTP